MPGPSGIRITDGFPTFITFSLNPTFELWETGTKPPGFSAGGENDTTTMRNNRFRTRQSKKLITATPCSGTAEYDPKIYSSMPAVMGINQLITVKFPDGSTLAFWGWLDSFEPNEHREGTAPSAAYTIIPSNQDNTGAEIAPVYTAPP